MTNIQIVVDSTKEIPNNGSIEIEDEVPICRICLEHSKPLVVLGCDCRGGIGQAHKKCLVKWFCQQRHASVFSFDGFPDYKKCEICRKNLSHSTQVLINDHWATFVSEIATLYRNRRMATQVADQVANQFRMTWRDLGYFLLGAIFITIIVGWSFFVNPELS